MLHDKAAGFTGTQQGMTPKQLAEVQRVLQEEQAGWFHHGDCIGADAQAHEIAQRLGLMICIHPPEDPRKRAWCSGDQTFPEKPYLIRNHDIVNQSDFLIATPKEYEEVLRSGTWATIRYARKSNKRVRIIYP